MHIDKIFELIRKEQVVLWDIGFIIHSLTDFEKADTELDTLVLHGTKSKRN